MLKCPICENVYQKFEWQHEYRCELDELIRKEIEEAFFRQLNERKKEAAATFATPPVQQLIQQIGDLDIN